LDIALLRCGELCESLVSFGDWLDDVENRQSKQKPFSIDHKALAPQRQIQDVCGGSDMWPVITVIQLVDGTVFSNNIRMQDTVKSCLYTILFPISHNY